MAFNPRAVSQHVDNNVHQEPLLQYLKKTLERFYKACEGSKLPDGTFEQQMKSLNSISVGQGEFLIVSTLALCKNQIVIKRLKDKVADQGITFDAFINTYLFSLLADIIKKYSQDFPVRVDSSLSGRAYRMLFPKLIKKLEEMDQQAKNDCLQNVSQEKLKPVLNFLEDALDRLYRRYDSDYRYRTVEEHIKTLQTVNQPEHGEYEAHYVYCFCLNEIAIKRLTYQVAHQKITFNAFINTHVLSLATDIINKYPEAFLFSGRSDWDISSGAGNILFPELIKKLKEMELDLTDKKQEEENKPLQKGLTIFKSFKAHVKKAKEKKENDESVILEKLIQTFTFQSTEKNSLKDVYQDEKVREYLLSACKTFGLENIDHLIDDMCEDEETDISDIAENNYSSYILDCIINLPKKEEEKNAQSIQAMIRTKACRKQFLTYKRTLEKLKKLVPEVEDDLRKGKYHNVVVKSQEIEKTNASLAHLERKLLGGSEKKHKKPRHEYNFNGMYAEGELKSTKEKPKIRKGSLKCRK